jgi:hypothetical protein
LRSKKKDSAELPFANRQRPPRKTTPPILPALSKEEALRLSKKELLERGYPPRPDPKALEPFRSWLRVVSTPKTIVNPRLTPNPGITHGPLLPAGTTNPIWSGFVLQGAGFSGVTGLWNVPVAFSGELNVLDQSALWVGIDGYNLSDLIQAGTEQNILQVAFFGNIWSFTSYYAWTEFLPQQSVEQVISNLDVNPGDEMSVSVNFDASAAIIFVSNLTTNESSTPVVITPSEGVVVPATTAE